MGNVPNGRREVLTFAASRQADWGVVQARIGLSAEQVNAVTGAVSGVQNATASADTARNAAKTATQVLGQNYTSLRRAVSEAVRTITTFAENQPTDKERDEVFNLANIQPPSPRRNNVPPNQPTNLTASLETTTGAVIVRWKASQPSGVVYSVYRSTGASGDFTLAGVTGEKKFADNGLTGGATRVSYFVVATKGTSQSAPSDTLTVRFGASGGGGGVGSGSATGNNTNGNLTFTTSATPKKFAA